MSFTDAKVPGLGSRTSTVNFDLRGGDVGETIDFILNFYSDKLMGTLERIKLKIHEANVRGQVIRSGYFCERVFS